MSGRLSDSIFLDQELEPLSSYKGQPDKPIESEEMNTQKKEIDAKLKNLFLFDTPEAVEPQNLLKTAASAMEIQILKLIYFL